MIGVFDLRRICTKVGDIGFIYLPHRPIIEEQSFSHLLLI